MKSEQEKQITKQRKALKNRRSGKPTSKPKQKRNINKPEGVDSLRAKPEVREHKRVIHSKALLGEERTYGVQTKHRVMLLMKHAGLQTRRP